MTILSRLRPLLPTLGISFVLSSVMALSAVTVTAAATGPKYECDAVTGVGPWQLEVGVEPTTNQFSVRTNCAPGTPIHWYVTAPNEGGPYGWLMIADFPQPPSSRYVYAPHGRAKVWADPTKTPGQRYQFCALAFVDGNNNHRDDGALNGDRFLAEKCVQIFMVAKSRFVGQLDVGPEPATAGKPVRVNGVRLEGADWATGTWKPIPGATGLVQHLEQGDSGLYDAVRAFRTDKRGRVDLYVPAQKSGTYRAWSAPAGHGGATSSTDYVKAYLRHR